MPEATTILLARQGGVGRDWPLTIEILCPVLSLHVVDGWREGCEVCIQTLKFGGLGHTLGVHSKDQAVLDAFFLEKPANRIIVNGPTSQGAVGYSTNLDPSVSLGCGPQAGNISSDNITARHLINVKRVAYPRSDWKEAEVADHARAAALGGERAPRGSGLPGDPSLAPAVPTAGGSASSWQGNPRVAAPEFRSATRSVQFAQAPRPAAARSGTREVTPSAQPKQRGPAAPVPKPAPARTPSKPMQPKVGPGTKSAPVFTGGSVKASDRLRPAPPSSSPAPARPSATAPLSTMDIQHILTQAGSGCPLGPCQGCPHQEVTTGACTA